MFDFTVFTASWLARQLLPKGFEFQHGTLLVERWNPTLIERAVSDLCSPT
jgi:hypothetical protein